MAEKDKSKISNAHYEIVSAAKAMGVEPYVIHLAKFKVGNDRAKVYEWVRANKGLIVEVYL